MRRLFAAPVCAMLCMLVTARLAPAQTMRIWPGVAPGSERWKQKEHVYTNTPLGAVAIDVVTPTLTMFRPTRPASKAAVIVAPGGACIALTLDLEGANVARWLAHRGITAFVLKYRLAEKKGEGIPQNIDMDASCKYGTADAIAALALVRRRAAAWGISPNKVGMLGFSAGAMVASGALLQPNAARRPDFAGLIYGAPFGRMPAIPAHVPPVFMAWAQDDGVALDPIAKFYAALRSAGIRPEAHIFAHGGHGFGLRKQGTTSDLWPDEFLFWLRAKGFVPRV